MRSKILAVICSFVALLLASTLNSPVVAQGPTPTAGQPPAVEWLSWNTQITAHANSRDLNFAETQNITITAGTLRSGQRLYTQPVTIQNVFLAINGTAPATLSLADSLTQAGTYTVATGANGQTKLDYRLPNPLSAGDTFVVQINYTVPQPVQGIVDWYAVPENHPFSVRASRLTLNFPDGQAPDTSFVRVVQGNGNITTSGNSIIITQQGQLAANQPFEVQAPFGNGIGTASSQPGNSVPAANPANNFNNTTNTQNQGNFGSNDPNATDTGGLPGIGTLLLVLCVFGFMAVAGGGGLLRGLLGGFGRSMLGGGGFGGGSGFGGGYFGGRSGPSNPFGGFGGGSSQPPVSSGGGFRQSSSPHEVPTINSDKGGGGGASFS